jgi:hypothetical protein
MPIRTFEATHDGSVDTLDFGFGAKQIVYKNDGSADHTLTISGQDVVIKAGESQRLPLSGEYAVTANGASGGYRAIASDEARPALELAKPANGYAVLEDDSLAGDKVATVADDNATSGVMVVHVINIAGGADANEDIIVADKCEVIRVDGRLDGAGTAGSTFQLFNTGDAISDQLDLSSAGDTDVFAVGELDNAHAVIAAGGTLRATIASSGSDFPPAKVFVTCVKRA